MKRIVVYWSTHGKLLHVSLPYNTIYETLELNQYVKKTIKIKYILYLSMKEDNTLPVD